MDGWDPNIIQLACLSILELFLLDCLIPWVPGYWCSGNFQTHVYRRPAVFSKPLIFATAFMSFFSVVIALFKVCDVLIWENVDQINLNIVVIFLFLEIVQKDNFYNFFDPAFFFWLKMEFIQDVPDLEGDKTFGIRTFTVRLGQKRVSSVHSSSECKCPTGYSCFYLIIVFCLIDLGRCSGLVFLYWK